MRLITLLITITWLNTVGCKTETNHDRETPEEQVDDVATNETQYIEKQGFSVVLDSANVNGVIVLYNLSADTFYSNDFKRAETGHLPASTFKITNSIIGLETGVINPDSTVFIWDGSPRRLKQWERDMDLHDAYHYSCLPCYQEVARAVGYKRMRMYLDTLSYGNMVVDSGNQDVFWVEGKSRITPMEQIDFLKRLYQKELPISESTWNIMRELMILEKTDAYTLRGKTGWSIREGHNTGWFVGYLEKNDEVWFFATCIDPKEAFNMDLFPVIRKEITMGAFKEMGVL